MKKEKKTVAALPGHPGQEPRALPKNQILRILEENALPAEGQPESGALLAAYNLMQCREVSFTMEGKKSFLRYIVETTDRSFTVSNDDMNEASRRAFRGAYGATVRLLERLDPAFAKYMAAQWEEGRYKLAETMERLLVGFNEAYDRPCVWRVVSILCLAQKREAPREWVENLMLLMDRHVAGSQREG